MASTFTTNFGFEEIATGEQAGTWGTTTNFNFDILDRIVAYKAVGLSGTTHTLTVREASPGQGTENLQDGMYRVIKFTGALGGNNTVTVAPNTAATYFILENATTDSGSSGPYSVIISQGTGANVTIENGNNALVYCDGAGSGAAVTNALGDLQVSALTVDGDATIGDDLTLLSDSSILGFGTNTDVTLTHNHDLGLSLSAGANATQLTITSTNAAASVAPTIALVRDSASPAASDQLGYINFVGEDAGSNATSYAQVYANIVDPTGGSEDGSLKFYLITNGSAVAALELTGESAIFNGDATIGDDLSLDSDASVIKFGDNQDVLLTHVHDSGLTMSVTGNNLAQLGVAADNDTASAGPYLNLTRTSASPADNDAGGIVQFVMENDNNQAFAAAQIQATAPDVSDGTEDGSLVINTMTNGSLAAALTLTSGAMTTGGNIVIPDAGTIGSASDTDAIAIRSDGNVGVNSAGSDTAKVTIYDNTTTDKLLDLHQDNASSAQTGLQITHDGTGIGLYSQKNAGTTSAVYGYNNSSAAGIGTRGHSVVGYGIYGQTGATGYAGIAAYSQNASQYALLGHANTYGVYTTSVTCVGAMSKGSGTFRIPHGLREGYDLCHSFIEGPQCDLIYRGRATLVDGQATISMDTKYGMTSGTFEWLTKADDVQTFTSNETGWDAVKSSFSGDTITIECQNSASTDTISWMVVAERGDPNIIASTITDDAGNLIIERPSAPAVPTPPED